MSARSSAAGRRSSGKRKPKSARERELERKREKAAREARPYCATAR